MPKIKDLLQQAAVIRDATADGENTALRIGTMFVSFIQAVLDTVPAELIDAAGISYKSDDKGYTLCFETVNDDGEKGQTSISIPRSSTNVAGLMMPQQVQALNKAVTDIAGILGDLSAVSETATTARTMASDLRGKLGAPGGIATLTKSGVLPEGQFPPNKDNVVMFDGFTDEAGELVHTAPEGRGKVLFCMPRNKFIFRVTDNETGAVTDHDVWSGAGKYGIVSGDIVMTNPQYGKIYIDRTTGIHYHLGILQATLEPVSGCVEITYGTLLALRYNKILRPGQTYRITDYETTVSGDPEATTAGHVFDLIVMATAPDKLSEIASAAVSKRDTSDYFASSRLEAWQIWYCLDNDTERFAWADTSGGKGVIYRMIDENGNDCPYDFKNVLFKRYRADSHYISSSTENYRYKDPHAIFGMKMRNTGSPYPLYYPAITYANDTDWMFTFSFVENNDAGSTTIHDASLPGRMHVEMTSEAESGVFTHVRDGSCAGNRVGVASDGAITEGALSLKRVLNHIVFMSMESLAEKGMSIRDNLVGAQCRDFSVCGSDNRFEDGCRYIILRDSNGNRLGRNCFKITLGEAVSGVKLGDGNSQSIAGDGCKGIVTGKDCSENYFGTKCEDITLGNNCKGNSFQEGCLGNIIGNYCWYNSFGIMCRSNIIGNSCDSNSFGKFSQYNHMGNDCDGNVLGQQTRHICLEGNVKYISLAGTGNNDIDVNADVDSFVQNVRITHGVSGSSEDEPAAIAVAPDQQTAMCVGYDSYGDVCMWEENNWMRKQEKLTTSEDLTISGAKLSLTDRAKMRLFDDLWRKAATQAGGPRKGDVDHSHRENGVSRPYSLNGMWLTYDEALSVYNTYHGKGGIQFDGAFCGSKARTNLPIVSAETLAIGLNLASAWRNSEIEEIDLSGPTAGSVCRILNDAEFIFQASKLKKINGAIQFRAGVPEENGWPESLQEVKIHGLDKNINLRKCKNLSLASLQYLVTNAANTATVNVAVHTDVLSKLTDEENTAWHQAFTAAMAKNIVFLPEF